MKRSPKEDLYSQMLPITTRAILCKELIDYELSLPPDALYCSYNLTNRDYPNEKVQQALNAYEQEYVGLNNRFDRGEVISANISNLMECTALVKNGPRKGFPCRHSVPPTTDFCRRHSDI